MLNRLLNRPILKTHLPWVLVFAFVLREAYITLSTHHIGGPHEVGVRTPGDRPLPSPAAADSVEIVSSATLPPEPFAWSEAEAREKLVAIIRQENDGVYDHMARERSFACSAELTREEKELVRSRLVTLPAPLTLDLRLDTPDGYMIDNQTAHAAMVDALGQPRTEEIFRACARSDEVQREKKARMYSVVLQDELGLVEEQRRQVEQMLVERSELEAKALETGGDVWDQVVAQEAKHVAAIRSILTAPQFERYLEIINDSSGSDLDLGVFPQPPEPTDESESGEGAGEQVAGQ